jgi:hypothetical protein
MDDYRPNSVHAPLRRHCVHWHPSQAGCVGRPFMAALTTVGEAEERAINLCFHYQHINLKGGGKGKEKESGFTSYWTPLLHIKLGLSLCKISYC